MVIDNMWRIRQALASFMYGRYGVDKLYWFLFVIWALLSIVNTFIGSALLYFAGLFVLAYQFFRVFSKNISKRSRENQRFLRFFESTKSFLLLQVSRIRDIGKKRYRRCKNCKAVLRLPIKRGKKSVKCPKCNRTFEVFILI